VSGSVTRTRQGAIAALAVAAAAGLSLSGIPQTSATPVAAKGHQSPLGARQTPNVERPGAYDARTGSAKTQLRDASSVVAGHGKAFHAFIKALGPQAVVDFDPSTGTPRNLGRLDGFLTKPSSAKASTITMRFVKQHLAVLGLTRADLRTFTLRRDYVDIAGIHHLAWTQSVDAIPVFGNGLRANVTASGRLLSLQGSPVSGLVGQAAMTDPTVRVSASRARALAASEVGGKPAVARSSASKDGTTVAWSNFDYAKKVWFHTPSGLRLGWSTYVQAGGDNLSYQHVIDASTGAVLYRHDTVDNDNDDALIYRNYPGARVGGTQQKLNFFKAGFLSHGAKRLTAGKYVAAWSDVNDNNQPDKGETVRVPGQTAHHAQYGLVRFRKAASGICSRQVICTWNPNKAFSWQVNRQADVTQGFYFDSTYHNYLERAPFGFTPRAGNFQRNGGDPVLFHALDGANTDHGFPDGNHVENANMNTPPNGIPPTMQMYLFHAPHTTHKQDPFVPASSAFDPTVILHEYTHGLSNRLVIDATGNSTLNSIQARAMGEAWSDYYAIDYLVTHGFLKDTPKQGHLMIGKYLQAGVNNQIVRTMPIDCSVGTKARKCANVSGGFGGYTYGDFPSIVGYPEVHASGEIWGQTLWDLRTRLGHKVTGMLVTRAMSLSPDDPSFLDERNSILQADTAIYGGAHRKAIWHVFAHRGMGFFAATIAGDDAFPVQNFMLPPVKSAPRGTLSGRVLNRLTGKPVRHALVVIGGHGSGFTGYYADLTNASGRYSISRVFAGTYPEVVVFAKGYEIVKKSVTVRHKGSLTNFKPRRDWATSTAGGLVSNFDGPIFGPPCGPDNAIDLSQVTGWVSLTGTTQAPTGTIVPKSIVVKLPRAITLTSMAVDPTAPCGLSGSASVGRYEADVSPNGISWTTAAHGTLAASSRFAYNPVTPSAPIAGVRYVRFTLKAPQVPSFTTNCPSRSSGTVYQGCTYMSMTELEVFGTP
jgi:extracellular elastinolytic metalloproteinase